MGWTYQDYMDAPLWMVDVIMIRKNEEGRKK
jgi:hypothetical protein